MLAGLLYYAFPQGVGFIAAVLIWQCDVKLLGPDVSRRIKRLTRFQRFALIAASCAATISGVAAAYRVLTGGLRVHGAIFGLACISAGLCAIAGLPLLRGSDGLPFHLESRRKAVGVTLFLSGIALIDIPVRIIFRLIVAPYFSDRGIELWAGNSYSWKQWRDWSDQLIVYID